jgi:hypothetical protein
VASHVADTLDIGDRGAAEFHHQARHKDSNELTTRQAARARREGRV